MTFLFRFFMLTFELRPDKWLDFTFYLWSLFFLLMKQALLLFDRLNDSSRYVPVGSLLYVQYTWSLWMLLYEEFFFLPLAMWSCWHDVDFCRRCSLAILARTPRTTTSCMIEFFRNCARSSRIGDRGALVSDAICETAHHMINSLLIFVRKYK